MVCTRIFPHCDLDLVDMTLGQGYFTPLCSRQLFKCMQRLKSYSQNNITVPMHFNLDLVDMTLPRGHKMSIDPWQQFSEILFNFMHALK